VLPNNIALLMTIEKFETNPMLANVNKLKPYKYMEFEVHKQKNRYQYIGNKVQVEFRWKILIWRKMMKIVKYKNHIYKVLKLKNR